MDAPVRARDFCLVLRRTLDESERMLVAICVDADGGEQHEVCADMQPVDLDDQKIQCGQIGVHECVELLRGQGHESPRCWGFRQATAMLRRHIALRQANCTAKA